MTATPKPSATIVARHDPRWSARVIARHDMVYEEGPSEAEDRPAHVRAASGLSAFREYIAVIQDDANWLALIGPDDKVTAVPLPPSPAGDRVFSEDRGNKDDKFDLEACVTVEGADGLELVAFASGSREERQWVLRVREEGAAGADGRPTLDARFVPADAFYHAMRARSEFAGAGLNIEGALSLGGDHVRLFQRGNAEPKDGLEAIDATADFEWRALCRHLADPETVPPPELAEVRTYDLGTLEGTRLTFSDAEHLGGGRVLYSASAEDPESGDIHGSVLGIIEADGSASWTELLDEDGSAFRGKVEGLTLDARASDRVQFVIDDDDGGSPSRLFTAQLSGDWGRRG